VCVPDSLIIDPTVPRASVQNVEVLSSYRACDGDATGPALRITGGVPWSTAYGVAEQAGYTVVGGSAGSVSACGGFVLGGGHSVSSPEFGLAVDNVLSFSVVLAGGSLVEASACSHPDLFWALRGGGGGSFGVLISVTYKLHPRNPVTGLTLVLSLLQGPASAQLISDALLASLPGMHARSGVVMGGFGFFSVSGGAHVLALQVVFNGTVPQAIAAAQPFMDVVAASPAYFFQIPTPFTFFPMPSYFAWQSAALSNDGGAGIPTAMVSATTPGRRDAGSV
jgi:FAD/FMN-containing dehydrogenase